MLNTMLGSVEGKTVNVKMAEGEKALDADSVILALGFNANDQLYKDIYANIPKKVWLLGDAKMPSNIMFGIRDANSIARAL